MAIREITGLRQRDGKYGGKQFGVRKIYKRGEPLFTYVVFFSREAEEMALKNRDLIEEVTAQRGYSFKFREIGTTGRYSLSNR